MSFNTFITKPVSQKTVIFEVDLSASKSNWFIHEAGIWKYKFTNVQLNTTANFENGSFCYGAFESSESGDIGDNAVIKSITSMIVDSVTYTSVSSLTTLRSTNSSFFYAGDTNLYVHFDSFNTPKYFTSIEIGVTDSYSNCDFYNENDQFVQGKIKSLPNLSIRKNNFYYGLQNWAGGDVTLANEDGYFDDYVNETLFGQPSRIKLGGTELDVADFKTVWTGSVKGTQATDEDFVFNLFDKRDQSDRTLAANFYDSTTYPGISDDNNGRPIPIAYGQCRDCRVVCTNETSAPATFSFLICDVADHTDGIKSIDAVYVNGTEVTPNSTNLITATFTITAASGDYTAGDEVTVDFKSYVDGSGDLITNSLDILKDIIEVYLDTTYSSDTFDTTAWTAQTLLAQDIGNIWLNDFQTFDEVVEKIGVSELGNLSLTGDGKWTFLRSNTSAEETVKIDIDEQFSPPYRTDPGTEYLTSATVKFYEKNNKNDSDRKWRTYTDNSQEATIKNQYGTYKSKEYETYLLTLSQAQSLASDIMDMFGTITPEFSVDTSIFASNVELLDTVVIEFNRTRKTWMGYNKCEVTGITYNLNDFIISLDLRFIETWTEIDASKIGHWTNDTETFPAWLGGSTISAWDPSWTLDQKLYAKANWGFWAEDSELVDNTDPESSGTIYDT